jgi:hypothetical protein
MIASATAELTPSAIASTCWFIDPFTHYTAGAKQAVAVVLGPILVVVCAFGIVPDRLRPDPAALLAGGAPRPQRRRMDLIDCRARIARQQTTMAPALLTSIAVFPAARYVPVRTRPVFAATVGYALMKASCEN